MTFDVTLAEAPLDTAWLSVPAGASGNGADLRRAWLQQPR
jgi:hypothetical protein